MWSSLAVLKQHSRGTGVDACGLSWHQGRARPPSTRTFFGGFSVCRPILTCWTSNSILSFIDRVKSPLARIWRHEPREVVLLASAQALDLAADTSTHKHGKDLGRFVSMGSHHMSAGRIIIDRIARPKNFPNILDSHLHLSFEHVNELLAVMRGRFI